MKKSKGGKREGAGRPSKFSEENKNLAIALAKQGKTDVQISDIIGISPRTLDMWKGKFPEFLRSLKEAKHEADDLVKASLFRRATGYYHMEEKLFYNKDSDTVKRVEVLKHYPPDTSAMIFWLKNRQPGEWRDTSHLIGGESRSPGQSKRKTFEEFCEIAGYPKPFAKQVEMMEFGIHGEKPRLLLGSRGYGKTDYVVILGIAYKIYCDWFDGTLQYSSLLVTKSDERNSAILHEIYKACEENGVPFEKKNSSMLRVEGLHGKDHSLSAITVRSVSVRGRHPKFIAMDDPVTEEDASEATRKQVQRLYNELNKLCPNILVIGQPVHKADLYQSLRPMLTKMEVPHGTIPELDHDLDAQRLAGVSEESIQASYFLKVISENPSPFEHVKYIDQYPSGDSVAFIDPSFEGGDYTAMTIGRAHFDGMAIQGYVWKKAWNHCIDSIAEVVEAYNVRRVCFETNSLGDMPISLLSQALPQSVGVVGKKSTMEKHSRIMNAGVFAHLIFLARTSDKKYIDQVVQYEYRSKFDDAPDSLASLLEWLGLIRGRKL